MRKADRLLAEGEKYLKLGDIYYHGLNGMNQDHISANKYYKEARKLLNKARRAGSERADYLLSCMSGESGNNDDEALQNTEDVSLLELGHRYCFGYGGYNIDYVKAVEYYYQSAEKDGDSMAMHNLGCMYENGEGVAQNYVEAVKWYRKAAELGYSDAQNNLGKMYETGMGVLQDYAEAFNLYMKSAEQNNATAQYNLGLMYQNGHGMPRDHEEALKWYKKAMDGGDEDAAINYDYLLNLMNGAQNNDVEETQVNQAAILTDNLYSLNFEELGKNLIRIRDQFSIEVLSEGRRTLSILSDYCPALKAERHIFSNMYDYGIVEVFINEKPDNKQEQERLIFKMKDDLVNVRRINPDDVDGCLKMLAEVFEWEGL